jgi:uncharacterized membrane protein
VDGEIVTAGRIVGDGRRPGADQVARETRWVEGDGGAAELRAVATDVSTVDDGTAAPAARHRAHTLFASVGPPELVLAGLVVAWTIVFIALPAVRHDRYGTFGFDLGIYDQGTWLLSQFKDPFVTIRGLELFGHHANLILLFFAPFYRLGAGPIFLLVVQVLAQASGAVALFLLGRDLLRSRWAGVAIAAAFLLNPTNQWLTWEFFHPDAVAIGPLLFAYWAARSHRWRWFTVAAVLALLCKEDVALAMAVLGILILVRGERRRGLVVAVLSTLWFLFCTRVLIPWQNGIGPFYDTFFGDLGKSPTEVAYNAVRHPSETWHLASADDRRTWYWRMLAPWGLLPLLDIGALLIAGPMILVNVLTAFPYTRDYRFHYSALVICGTAVATVEAIAWISRQTGRGFAVTRNVLVGVVLVSAIVCSRAWGASPLASDYDNIWPLRSDPRAELKTEAIAMVPARASLSTAYNIAPHVTHREKVYEFPVPWCNINWGVKGENLDDPAQVDWLLIDRNLVTSNRDKALLADLLGSEFSVVSDRSDIVVAHRVHPPQQPAGPSPPPGRCYARPSLEAYQ